MATATLSTIPADGNSQTTAHANHIASGKATHSPTLYDDPPVIFAHLLEIEAEASAADLSDWLVIEDFGKRAKYAFSHPRRISNVATRMDMFLNSIVQKMKNECNSGKKSYLAIIEMFYAMKLVACALPNAPEDMMQVAIFRIQTHTDEESAA